MRAERLVGTEVMGDANCLVTGDQDLPAMSGFRGIPILTPAAFLYQWREHLTRIATSP